MKMHFTKQDLVAFGDLSGDNNPMHVNPVYARRTLYGDVVVHGLYGVLSMLCAAFDRPVYLTRVKARFDKPVYTNQDHVVEITHDSHSHKCTITLTSEVEKKTEIVAEYRFADAPFEPAVSVPDNRPDAPVTLLEFENGMSGVEPLYSDGLETLPQLGGIGNLPPYQVGTLLALTRIVGMHCPGEHSVFYDFDLSFSAEVINAAKVPWTLTMFDERFNMLIIDLKNEAISGAITAFVRPRRTEQLSTADVAKRVSDKDLSGSKALVIGGSRGLGELTSKILAVRGSNVTITYNRGADEAEKVAADITAYGGSAKTAAFNVLSDEDCRGNGPVDISAYDLVLYFPTPSIFRGSQNFSGSLFAEFLQFYVNSFTLIAETLRDSGKESVLFYPSTVALDEHTPNMLEYSAAKIAGEYTCEYITQNFNQPQIVMERLPRLPTDQTSTISVIPFKFEAYDVMKNVVDKMVNAVK